MNKHKNQDLINAWKSYKSICSYRTGSLVETAYQRYIDLGGTHKRLHSVKNKSLCERCK